MATFETEVEALTGISIDGSSNPTQTELSSFLVDGVVDVVNRMIALRPAELSKFTKTTHDTNAVVKKGQILSVVREHDSTAILRKCTKIDAGDRYDATDSDSLSFRSKTSPGYYELNGSIYTVPAAGSGNNDVVVTQVHYDTGLVYSDNYNAAAIENFPTDYERLVALYAAIQALKRKMGANIISITAVPPDIPTLSVQSITITGTAPTYTAPTQTISGTAWATAYPDQYGDITTAWAAINTELDETQAICDSINTNVDSAVSELAEAATQVDSSVDTALAAMVTAAGRINTAVLLANGQFDASVLEAAQAEGEADDGAVATALTAINTNVDLANAIIDVAPAPPDVPTISSQSVTITGTAPTYTAPTHTISGTAWATAYPDEYSAINTALAAIATEIGLAKTEAAEIVTQTDNSGDFETALDAMNTELDKADDIIVEASAEFDESKNLTAAYNSGQIATALDAIQANVDLANAVIDVVPVPPDVPTLSTQSVSITGTAPTYTPPTQTISGVAWATEYPSQVTTINVALAAMVTELAETQAIADKIDTEIGLANAEVDDALTEIAEAITLTDSSSSDIKTAVDAMNTALDHFRGTSDPALFGDEDQYLSGVGLAHVKDALDNAQQAVDDGASLTGGAATHDAVSLLTTEEDVELVNGALSIAQTEISRANAHIGEWNVAADTLVKEINGFAAEAGARYGWISAKAQVWNGELAAAQGYMATANGYGSEIQSKIAITQGYSNEIQSRLSLVSPKVSEFQAKVSDALNTFNDANVEFQAQLQADIQNAQLLDGNEAKKLQKYSAEIAEYQAELGEMTQRAQGYLNIAQGYSNEVQSYTTASQTFITTGNAYISEAQAYIAQAGGYAQEVSARGGFTSAKSQAVQGYIQTAQGYASEVQSLLSQTPAKVSEFQAKVADALNTFNDANVEYQAVLQKDIQDAQLSDANEAKKLQKYSAEIAEYQAELGEMTQRAQGYLNIAQGYAAEVTAYQTSTQIFVGTSQNRINAGNAFLAEASAGVQELTAYGSEVSSRIAQVGGYSQIATGYIAAAQGFATEIQTKINIAQGYSSEIQSRLAPVPMKVSEFQAKAQDAINVFNDANVEYQAVLQKNIQDAQLADANEARKLQKYSAEVAEYSAEVNTEVQEKTTKMQQYQLLHTQLKADYDAAFVEKKAEA